MNGEIQYRFALDEAGEIVDVFSLHNHENIAGRAFRCVVCKEALIARLGTNVTHHFAHKSNSHCSGETYLHELAKKVFQEEFEKCLNTRKPFYIELEQNRVCNQYPGHSESLCRLKPSLKLIDLVPHFYAVVAEKEMSDFKPDVTLVSKKSKNNIWVEIAVTHKCSDAKLRSKNRIIEISIRREDDVDMIRRRMLSSQDNRVSFYHFKKELPTNMCAWPFRNCRLAKRVVKVYEDGNWEVSYLRKTESLSDEEQKKVVWWNESFVDYEEQPATEADYEYELRAAAKESIFDVRAANFHIRACGLCEHFDYFGTQECSIYEERVPWKQAIKCKDFLMADYDKLGAITAE